MCFSTITLLLPENYVRTGPLMNNECQMILRTNLLTGSNTLALQSTINVIVFWFTPDCKGTLRVCRAGIVKEKRRAYAVKDETYHKQAIEVNNDLIVLKRPLPFKRM